MNTNKPNEYETPEVVCVEMNIEGVLCQSADIEIEDGGDVFEIE